MDEFNVYRDVDREAMRDYDPEPDERPSWHEAQRDPELAVPAAPGFRCRWCGWTVTTPCDGGCLT